MRIIRYELKFNTCYEYEFNNDLFYINVTILATVSQYIKIEF